VKFCSGCGASIISGARFCTQCGVSIERSAAVVPEGKVRVPGAQRRVHPGQLAYLMSNPEALAEWDEDIFVDPESEEARLASMPFDASRPPGPNDWVPVDCVWAIAEYPGRPGLIAGGKLADRFANLGTLQGRPLSEIVSYVGEPNVRTGDTASWHQSSFFSNYVIVLQFDEYGVCMGVTGEAST